MEKPLSGILWSQSEGKESRATPHWFLKFLKLFHYLKHVPWQNPQSMGWEV